MKDENKTKEGLIKELKELRLKNSELEKSKADYRQADKELREREVKYRLIAENTSDLICVTSFNLKATYIYVNHSYKKILGYEPEELIGKSSLDFIHPDDKRKLLPLLKEYFSYKVKDLFKLKEKYAFKVIELRFRHKAGDWRYLQTTANFIGNDLLFISKDITERMQIEEALRENEEKYRLIIENQTDLIDQVDLEGTIQFASPSYCRMFGKTEEELLGTSAWHLVHEEDREITIKAMEDLYKPPYRCYVEQRVYIKRASFNEIFTKFLI